MNRTFTYFYMYYNTKHKVFLEYALSHKEVAAFKLSVTLSNLNRFSKILHC